MAKRAANGKKQWYFFMSVPNPARPGIPAGD
jgi:hypothetical protein